MHTDIDILCPIHGEFKQKPLVHLNSGCKLCGNDRISKSKLSNTENFIAAAQEIHGEKFSYKETIYKSSREKVIIECKKHGVFEQLANDHLQGAGCTECKWEKVGIDHGYTLEDFIKKSNAVHNNKYIYDKVIYKKSSIKVIIKCPIHGDFNQLPEAHMKGQGCSKCGGSEKLTKDEFIARANKIHTNRYSYNDFSYDGFNIKSIIKCKKHGDFKQTPHSHLSGSGCPKCNINSSLIENKWLDIIGILEENRQWKIPGTNFVADGYNPTTNTIYEFDGDYFHGNPDIYNHNDLNMVNKMTFGECYERTLKKRQRIIELGYELIWVWRSDFKKGLLYSNKENNKPFEVDELLKKLLNGK
jgi:hypothetical protein